MYMDETKSTDHRYAGYGALISYNSNEVEAIISNAWSVLEMHLHKSRDPRLKDTYDRGHFHASDDGDWARSILCEHINTLKNAVFSCYIVDTHDYYRNINRGLEIESMHGKKRNRALGKIVKKALEEAAFNLCVQNPRSYREPITIWREADTVINAEHYLKKLKEYQREELRMCYKTPYSSYVFPDVYMELTDKKNPNAGVQICDFLAWACMRKLESNNDSWFDKINVVSSWGFSINNNVLVNNRFEFMAYKPYDKYYESADYNDSFWMELLRDENYIWNMFCEAQLIIGQYSTSGNLSLPPYASQLQSEFDEFSKLKNDCCFRECVLATAKLYLMLFDTIPLIDALTPKENKPYMLFNKKFMGLLLDQTRGEAVSVVDFFVSRLAYEHCAALSEHRRHN